MIKVTGIVSFSLSNFEGWTLGHGKPWKKNLLVDLGIGRPLSKWL
jgi:hypothetical protein